MSNPKIALGTWAWGAGAFGGDSVFGSNTDENNLKPVFDAAMGIGLNLWDTATAYGMGEAERILGKLASSYKREDVLISTKFTPQMAEMCGKVRRVGVSNHNITEIRRANEILGDAGFKVSAVQNHFSLLYRSSEKGGVLDFCKDNGIEFWAYMVLEQGALSGKYNMQNPLPAGSERGLKYNPILPQLENLTAAMKEIGDKYGASVSQIGIAWAVSKGTMPIIGATKAHHITEAAEAAKIALTADEVATLEGLADATGIDTRGEWEHTME